MTNSISKFISHCEATPHLAFQLFKSMSIEEIKDLATQCHIAKALVEEYVDSPSFALRRHQVEYVRSQWLNSEGMPKQQSNEITLLPVQEPGAMLIYDGYGAIVITEYHIVLTNRELTAKICLRRNNNHPSLHYGYQFSATLICVICFSLHGAGMVMDRGTGSMLYTLSGHTRTIVRGDDPETLFPCP